MPAGNRPSALTLQHSTPGRSATALDEAASRASESARCSPNRPEPVVGIVRHDHPHGAPRRRPRAGSSGRRVGEVEKGVAQPRARYQAKRFGPAAALRTRDRVRDAGTRPRVGFEGTPDHAARPSQSPTPRRRSRRGIDKSLGLVVRRDQPRGSAPSRRRQPRLLGLRVGAARHDARDAHFVADDRRRRPKVWSRLKGERAAAPLRVDRETLPTPGAAWRGSPPERT